MPRTHLATALVLLMIAMSVGCGGSTETTTVETTVSPADEAYEDKTLEDYKSQSSSP